MSSTATKIAQLELLRQELLNASSVEPFEVHQGPPPFWTEALQLKLHEYLSHSPLITYSECPHCGHKIQAPQVPDQFNDPWWMNPHGVFQSVPHCEHFEALTFSILWPHSEPMGAPWVIPCGWGTPAVSEALAQAENLSFVVKVSRLPNGATLFWQGLFREYANLPVLADYWPLPILKTAQPIPSSLNSRGYWGEYAPPSVHSAFVWSRLYVERQPEEFENYPVRKDTASWLQKIRTWQNLCYSQPLKMQQDRFISESGLASFAIGMRTSRTKGALFISQAPVFATWPPERPLQRVQEGISEEGGPYIQALSMDQMRGLAETETLWALIDPFQNEIAQDWLRLIAKSNEETPLIPLWRESELGRNWHLTADSSISSSVNTPDLVTFYRDLSPILVKITPALLELSFRYSLGTISWGAFFLSSQSAESLHDFLRHKLICYFQNQWIYFRFYEPNFLSVSLSSLRGTPLNFFYGPIEGWILRNSNETSHSLYTTNEPSKANNYLPELEKSSLLSPYIHEVAQRAFQIDQPRRIRDFVKERTPEFSDLISAPILGRWIRESVRQANHWGLHKEGNVIKFFLWKVLITPTWCHLPPFIRILQQPIAEEIKVQQIETLFPQIRLADIPRNLTIEAWDSELWIELREAQSPLAHAEPEAFHPLLGERPPPMPLQNPNWMRALGLFYESAYSDLQSHSGMFLLDSIFTQELERPIHPPPRLLSLSPNEILIRDEGTRSHSWLKRQGFESLAATQGNWIFRSNDLNSLLLIARQFLEEFPYIDSRYTLLALEEDRRQTLTHSLDVYIVNWDSHHFWLLQKL